MSIKSKPGFTVLELLVASLLLSMLVTILTMIFNQSSVAWRTGISDVVELGDTRRDIGALHDIEDDALPGLGETGAGAGAGDNRKIEWRTVSIFKNWGGGNLSSSDQSRQASGRLYDRIDADGDAFPWTMSDVRNGGAKTLSGGSSRAGSAFIVGVRSWGPDRRLGTKDDISTYFEEESK